MEEYLIKKIKRTEVDELLKDSTFVKVWEYGRDLVEKRLPDEIGTKVDSISKDGKHMSKYTRYIIKY